MENLETQTSIPQISELGLSDIDTKILAFLGKARTTLEVAAMLDVAHYSNTHTRLGVLAAKGYVAKQMAVKPRRTLWRLNLQTVRL